MRKVIEMSQNQVSTLKRGLLVLEWIKESSGVGLSDVMHEFKLSKSTAFRLLTTLEDMQYIYKIQTKYFLNPNNFMELSEQKAIRQWTSLNAVYQAALNLNMSTYLGKLDGTDLVMTQVLHQPYTTTAEEEIGNRTKLHQTALGKVILAFMNEEKLSATLASMYLEASTLNTFQDQQLFRYHLAAIRHDGYALDDEELNIGLRCVAVPVFVKVKLLLPLQLGRLWMT